MAEDTEIGSTLEFVNAQGFAQEGRFTVVLGCDGTRRLVAELFADADRPDVRPAEAYFKLYHSLQPGWTVRMQQIFWSDPEPRAAFLQRLQAWENRSTDGLEILYQGLALAVEQLPLPFLRRTFIEFVLPGDEGLAWWEGLHGMFASYGVNMKYLEAGEIQEIAYRILNPGFEES